MMLIDLIIITCKQSCNKGTKKASRVRYGKFNLIDYDAVLINHGLHITNKTNLSSGTIPLMRT